MSRVTLEQRRLGFLRLPFAAKRRRVRPLLQALRRAALASVTLLLCALVMAWVLGSPVFALSEVSFDGAERVSADWLYGTLAEWRGRNLVSLDLSAVQSQLLAHDWIRRAELRKILPDRLTISIEERQARALLHRDERRFYLDETGAVITAAEEVEAEEWLAVRISDQWWRAVVAREDDSEAEQLLWEFLREQRPGLEQVLQLARDLEVRRPQQRVMELLLLGRDDVQLKLAGWDFPVRLELLGARDKLVWLERLLPELERRFGAFGSVDLRFSRRIILRPAGESFPPASRLG